jgi:hypothetical protein
VISRAAIYFQWPEIYCQAWSEMEGSLDSVHDRAASVRPRMQAVFLQGF